MLVILRLQVVADSVGKCCTRGSRKAIQQLSLCMKKDHTDAGPVRREIASLLGGPDMQRQSEGLMMNEYTASMMWRLSSITINHGQHSRKEQNILPIRLTSIKKCRARSVSCALSTIPQSEMEKSQVHPAGTHVAGSETFVISQAYP